MFYAYNEDSDQTALMRRLIWVFGGRIYYKVRFLTFRRVSFTYLYYGPWGVQQPNSYIVPSSFYCVLDQTEQRQITLSNYLGCIIIIIIIIIIFIIILIIIIINTIIIIIIILIIIIVIIIINNNVECTYFQEHCAVSVYLSHSCLHKVVSF